MIELVFCCNANLESVDYCARGTLEYLGLNLVWASHLHVMDATNAVEAADAGGDGPLVQQETLSHHLFLLDVENIDTWTDLTGGTGVVKG